MLQTAEAQTAFRLRWAVNKRLQAIEEYALDPQGFESDGPSMLDAKTRQQQASTRGDREAEREAIVDQITAETIELFSGTSELPLLTDLHRRAARRREGCGSVDSRRPPSHEEGLSIARRLLTRAQSIGKFDREREAQQVARALELNYLYDSNRSKTRLLKIYIERSESSPACFDTLCRTSESHVRLGKGFPVQLGKWWEEIAFGLRPYPAQKIFPARRPVDSAIFLRDVEIHFTIFPLRRLGVPPQGNRVSGCRIVAEVLGLSEDSVIRIWKMRIPEANLEKVLRRQLQAMSERTGLVSDMEAWVKLGPPHPPSHLSGQN